MVNAVHSYAEPTLSGLVSNWFLSSKKKYTLSPESILAFVVCNVCTSPHLPLLFQAIDFISSVGAVLPSDGSTSLSIQYAYGAVLGQASSVNLSIPLVVL